MSAAILTLGSVSAKAQGKNEVNLFAGFMNATYTSINQEKSCWYRQDLYSLYEPFYNITCEPTVTLDYNRRILGWLGVGAQANWAYLYGTGQYVMGSAPRKDFKQSMMAVLPQVKFFIPSPRHFRLYAKIATGIGFTLGDTVIGKPVSFAWDIVPIGFEWGGQVIYGSAEVSVGNVITGARIGIGYRF